MLGFEDKGYRVEAMDLAGDRPWVLYALPCEESYAWVREVEVLDDPDEPFGAVLGEAKSPLQDAYWLDLDEEITIN
jgi:hypothetical protein